ncbi:hypothetical protein [Gordonia terrae]
MAKVTISLLGCDRTRWDVAGPLAGRQGAIIAEEQVDGIYDAPIKQEWSEDADQAGGTWEHTTWGIREILLGFHLFEDDYPGPDGRLESNFRNAFAMHRDQWDPNFRHARLVCRTELSGVRMLTVQMYEAPETDLGMDPLDEQYFNVKYKLRAANPMWMGKEHVEPFERSGTSGSGTILVSNPTDQPMRITWKLTRGTWTIPDPSWVGPPNARVPGGAFGDRTIPLPTITSADGGVTITRERKGLHATTANGTNFVGRMAGNWVKHEIPPWTQPTELPISYTGAPSGGARAELIQPRPWSRPWGLERIAS